VLGGQLGLQMVQIEFEFVLGFYLACIVYPFQQGFLAGWGQVAGSGWAKGSLLCMMT
jgi:hypothetical protein